MVVVTDGHAAGKGYDGAGEDDDSDDRYQQHDDAERLRRWPLAGFVALGSHAAGQDDRMRPFFSPKVGLEAEAALILDLQVERRAPTVDEMRLQVGRKILMRLPCAAGRSSQSVRVMHDPRMNLAGEKGCWVFGRQRSILVCSSNGTRSAPGTMTRMGCRFPGARALQLRTAVREPV